MLRTLPNSQTKEIVMKVLVIGGSNFISPHVVHQLLKMGHEVTVFNRGKTQTDLPKEVKWIKGDRLLSFKHQRFNAKILFAEFINRK
jgi:nucleoside-diphosphate-sugar epimerase